MTYRREMPLDNWTEKRERWLTRVQHKYIRSSKQRKNENWASASNEEESGICIFGEDIISETFCCRCSCSCSASSEAATFSSGGISSKFCKVFLRETHKCWIPFCVCQIGLLTLFAPACYQCDQMPRLFSQYLANCNKENLPNCIFFWESMFKILPNTLEYLPK